MASVPLPGQQFLPPGMNPEPPRYPPGPDYPYNKLTRGHSCVLCQQRKVRCDKQKPCANCVKAGVECRVVPPQPPRRRKKNKPQERDLIDRLRKYESLLSQHGVDFDPIAAADLKAHSTDHGDDVADLENDMSGLRTSPSSTADHGSPEHGHEKSALTPPCHGCLQELTLSDRQKWFPFSKEVSFYACLRGVLIPAPSSWPSLYILAVSVLVSVSEYLTVASSTGPRMT